jgi:hypothetical protein
MHKRYFLSKARASMTCMVAGCHTFRFDFGTFTFGSRRRQKTDL